MRRPLLPIASSLTSLLLVLGILLVAPIAAVAALPAQAGGDPPEVVVFADTVTLTWREPGRVTQALSVDGGLSFGRRRPSTFEIKLRYADFDPLVQGTPPLPPELSAGPANELWIVQYAGKAAEAWREELRARGGSELRYLAQHAAIWRMSSTSADALLVLPFVRWVGPMHAAYKLQDEIMLDYLSGGLVSARYNLVVDHWGGVAKDVVAAQVLALGGTVERHIEQGWILEATLTPEQLVAVASLPEVLGIDRWSLPEEDMDKVRAIMGADYIESLAGYDGTGVRAEDMDGNLNTGLSAWRHAPILHGSRSGSDSHGTSTYSINFADTTSSTRGMAPDAQGIFADYGNLGNRYTHTARLVTNPYFAVYQSNSWGNTRTFSYTSISQQMDDIIHLYDIVITQSQSNAGNQDSRPQAWAKNIMAVGGIRHYDDMNSANDAWANGASTGPAADGRVKPDLSAFYDSVATVNNSGFGGTSAASPIVAGHFALLFEMWHDGIFGNTPGATVFDSRPHNTLARALMIQSATQWPDNQTDITRMRQGWGRPDLRTLYDRRGQTFWVNETDLLQDDESVAYALEVSAGQPDLRATMVYSDYPGTTSSSLHRINDLSLRVTSPSGVRYWGNQGLLTGAYNWSTSGGSANTKDVVENVFVQNPEAGIWTVEIFADEVNQDTHAENGVNPKDADFALVVSPAVENDSCGIPNRIDLVGPGVGQVGSPVALSYATAPPSAPFVILYSLGQSGSLLQGHCFDVGPNAKVGFNGTTNALGEGSFNSDPLPNAALGRTLALEMGALHDGVIWDSTVTVLQVQ